MSKKAKPVSDLAKSIANLGLNFAENQVEKKIGDPFVEKGVKLVFPVTRELLEVLNDDNPANAEQVKDLVLSFVNEDLTAFLGEVSERLLAKVDDAHHVALLQFAFKTAIGILKAYTDEEANNKAQVQEMVHGLIDSGELLNIAKLAIVAPALDKAGASDDLKAFIVKAMDVAFDAIKK